MQLIVLLSVVALAASQTYNSDNDDLDVEAVVKNVDSLRAFYGCFVDTSSCDAVQDSFKKDLSEAVQQACAKCTPAQKHILRRFLEGLKEQLPQEYQNFKNKFDPKEEYFSALESAIAQA